jgi:predicted nucleotidyltransferase
LSEYSISIEPNKELVLRSVDEAANKLGIKWFVCGAGARILVCENIYSMRPGRATLDLDFAVLVDSLEQYKLLKDLLCEKYNFRLDPYQAQRLHHRSGYAIDIVPFGKVGGPGKKVVWEDDGEREMSIIGFSEAYSTALEVSVNDGIAILLPNYAALFGLKLVAWADRCVEKGTNDARDIAYLIVHTDQMYSDVLYNEYETYLKQVGYDFELASAYALGHSLCSTFSTSTNKILVDIIENELADTFNSLLVLNVSKGINSDDPEKRTSELLAAVLTGLRSE